MADNENISYSQRLSLAGGRTLAAADFALGAGWGTGATVAVSAGSTEGAWEITVTAGTTPSANPDITLTYGQSWVDRNGSPKYPFTALTRSGGDDTNPAAPFYGATTPTICYLVYQGTPVNTKVYSLVGVTIG